MVNVALPAISDDLGAGLAGQQWVVEAYLLAMVSLLLVGGSLGDQFGRRRIFVDRAGRIRGDLGALRARARRTSSWSPRGRFRASPAPCSCPGSLAIVAATFEGEARGRAVGMWTAWTRDLHGRSARPAAGR